MRRLAMKALFAALNLNRAGRRRIDRDRIVLIVSVIVTAALMAIYVYGKTGARW
jgi:hypothetical protein